MRRTFNTVERAAAAFAWPYAVIYAGMWLMAIATVRGMTFLSVDPYCATVATKITPLWYCTDGALMGLVATLANASLLVTLWVPSFIVVGLVNPYSAAIALPILLVHAIGVPTSVYALVRIAIALMENVLSPAARMLADRLRAIDRKQPAR